MGADWRLKKTLLPYKFTAFRIFSLPLSSQSIDTHFSKFSAIDNAMLLAPESWNHSVDCAVILSHPVAQPVSPILYASGYIRYVPFQYRNYYIRIQGSFSDYLKKFSHKSRYNILRSVRLYNKFCDSEKPWREFRKVEEIEEFYRLALEVSKKTYQERILGGGLPQNNDFFVKLKDMASRDLVRGYILFHGIKPIAYLYCPIVHDSVLLYAHVGYVQEYRKWSPGTILQYYALSRAFEEGRCRFFDFERGGNPQSHKCFFSTDNLLCADIYYFKRCLKNLLIIYSHYSLCFASTASLKILEILGMKYSIKRWLKDSLNDS